MKKAKNSLGILAIICLCIAIFLVYSRCREEESSAEKSKSAGEIVAVGEQVSALTSSVEEKHQEKHQEKPHSLKENAKEIIELRTETSKTFDNGDGTGTVFVSMGGPIHYRDPITNELKDIKKEISIKRDLPLSSRLKRSRGQILSSVDKEYYDFANEENSLRSYFKARSKHGNLMRVEIGDYYIIWQPVAIKWVSEEGEELISNIADVPGVSQGDKIKYENLFKDVDEEFIVDGGRVKDNIILKSSPVSPTIGGENISLVIEGQMLLSPELKLFLDGIEQISDFETSSNIELKNIQGESIGFIQRPFVYDNNQTTTPLISYQIQNTGHGIAFKVEISGLWLLGKDIVYPVIIDPTIYVYNSYDSFIANLCPTTNYGFDDNICVGYDSGVTICPYNWGVAWGLVANSPSASSSPGIPSCIPSSNITGAYLNAYVDSSDSQGSKPSIRPERITSTWSESAVTWNNAPSYYSTDNNETYTPSSGWEWWDVTNSVRKWKDGYSFYGFYLRPISYDTSGDNWVSFYSYEHANDCGTKNPAGNCRTYIDIYFNYQCTPSLTCCDSSGCFLSSSTPCGTKDCDYLDTTCRNYNDKTRYCNGAGTCGDPACDSYTNAPSSTPCGTKDCDPLDTACRNYNDVTKYCDGAGSCGDPACNSYSNYPAGTECPGICSVCDGSGNCSSYPADDPACGTIDCDGLDTNCRNYNDLTSNRCEGLNDCKDANSGDCTSYTNYSSSTSCGTKDCDYLDTTCRNYNDVTKYCDGAGSCGDPSCNSYIDAPSGTDCGTCQACNGSGSCSSTPSDDSDCGIIDCDGLDTTCANYNDLSSNRCEGFNDCKDANSGDCTNFTPAPAGTSCGLCSTCNGSGACSSVPADDANCGIIDCDGLDTTCRNYNDLSSNRCEGLGDCKDANSGDCTNFTDAPEFTPCGASGEQCKEGECITTCAYKIIKPNGGNRWKAGRRYKITWAKYGPLCGDSTTYVKLQYSTNGGKKWRKIKNMTFNDGVQRWKVPDRATRNALVKLTDYDTPAYFDISDRKFKILSSAESVSYSSAPLELVSEEADQASELVADAPDGEDLSPEQLAAEDEEGEGRFGCMMTSGNADSGRIWSMLIYGLPVVVALYFRRRRKA